MVNFYQVFLNESHYNQFKFKFSKNKIYYEWNYIFLFGERSLKSHTKNPGEQYKITS